MTLLLLGVRLKSLAEPAALAAVIPLDESDVAQVLGPAAEAGWVVHREGRLAGWTLTAAGRVEGERRLAVELDDAGARDAVAAAYADFLRLNAGLLTLCTDWQLRTVGGQPVPNDHSDPVHDKDVVDRLGALDEVAQPIVASLADALDRFARYGPRLALARSRVEGGDGDWFTKPTIDSYHSVWFELHENLLATLGIDRSSEPPAGTP